MRLGARAEETGRDARHRRRTDAGSVAVQRGAGGKGYGVALNNDRRRDAAGPVGRFHAPADALHYPHILSGGQQRVVVGHNRFGGIGHFRFAHPAVNPQVAQRVVKPVDVAVKPKSSAAESAGSVKDGVAVQKAPVVDG